jgi:hypothetical protein
MKTNNYTLFATAVLLFFAQCKNEGTKTQETKAASPATTSATPSVSQPKPEVYLYATVYDAMQLREAPNKTATVVDKLLLGQILEGQNEQSAEKTEAMLGGVTWNEPFYRAAKVGDATKSGWVFGGGIQPIYIGSKAEQPDLARLNKFAELLRTLKTTKLESGKAAWDYVRANFTDVKGATADAALVMLERFIRRIEAEGNFYTLTEKVKWSEADYNAVWESKYDMTKKPLDQRFDAAGYTYAAGEGMIYPVQDKRKLQAFFTDKCSPSMKKYLEMEVFSQVSPETTDAHLIISQQDLADRCAAWQKFNLEYPYFVYGDETRESARWMHLVMVNVPEVNATMFDPNTGAPTPETLKAWEHILQKYAELPLGRDIKSLSELVKSEGNKKTAKVEAWLEAFTQKMQGKSS